MLYEANYHPVDADKPEQVYLHQETAWDEDGTTNVRFFNTYGDLLSDTTFDAEGNAIFEEVHQYTYSDAGVMLTQTVTSNGDLLSETVYSQTTDGKSYVSYEILYNPDGTTIREGYYNSIGEDITEIENEVVEEDEIVEENEILFD